jgi:hypothetical protein
MGLKCKTAVVVYIRDTNFHLLIVYSYILPNLPNGRLQYPMV